MTQEELKKIDWTTHCLRSTYHNGSDEVYIKVYSVLEATPTGFFEDMKELCFHCQCYEGQGYRTEPSYLRCSLLDSLYEVVEIPKRFKFEQTSIFDFIN